MLTVYDAISEEKLDGSPSGALTEASEAVGGTGVYARMIDGIWTLDDQTNIEACRERFFDQKNRLVYVTA